MLIHRLRAVRCALVLAPLIAVLVFAPGVLARFKNAGAGGCGNFDTVIASAQAGDVLAPMRGGVNTNGATISETVVMQGGWVPNTGDCNDAGTNTFDNTAAMLTAGFAFDPADPKVMRATLEPLQPGVYTVKYQSLSADDDDYHDGAYQFTVLNPDGSELGSGVSSSVGPDAAGEADDGSSSATLLAGVATVVLVGGALVFALRYKRNPA